MSSILNLKPGMHIVMTLDREQDGCADFGAFGATGRPCPPYTGIPLRVLAVSTPFIGVTDGFHRFSIDSRRFAVQLVNKDYVREMQGMHMTQRNYPDSFPQAPDPLIKTRKKKSRPDPAACPRCGSRTVQRRRGRRSDDGVNQSAVWFRFCKTCGWDGDLVEK